MTGSVIRLIFSLFMATLGVLVAVHPRTAADIISGVLLGWMAMCLAAIAGIDIGRMQGRDHD